MILWKDAQTGKVDILMSVFDPITENSVMQHNVVFDAALDSVTETLHATVTSQYLTGMSHGVCNLIAMCGDDEQVARASKLLMEMTQLPIMPMSDDWLEDHFQEHLHQQSAELFQPFVDAYVAFNAVFGGD